MWRLSGLAVVLGLWAGASIGQAWAQEPQSPQRGGSTANPSPVIQAHANTELQKCRALNRCRAQYTRCYNKLEAQHKLENKEECVKPYQKCIHANFSGMEFFFQRWFVPDYIDCSKYSG